MKHKLENQRRVLDSATLDRMHEAALAILARTGMAVEHPAIRAEIIKRPGFQLRDGRICITPERVAAWKEQHDKIRASAAKPADASDPAYHYGIPHRQTFIVDRDGLTVRPMTRKDVIEGTKLITVLGEQDPRIGGSTPGVPTDVPLELQPLEQFMIGAQYAKAGGQTIATNLRIAEAIAEMNLVYGRRQNRRAVWCPSPLILGGQELDLVWHFRDTLEQACVGTMPIMGLTAPCDPVATFTLAIAECMGGAVILSELLPQVTVTISPHPEPADMRTGAIVMGTPEWDLLDMMHRDVGEYYHHSMDRKMLHTTAPIPNAQAIMEHTGSAMLGMLYGYRNFNNLGQLSLDEVFSPAMLILDIDILNRAQRIASGVESGQGLEFAALPEVVEEVVGGKMIFAEHPTTSNNIRRQYFQARVMNPLARAQWECAGRPDPVRQAQGEADRLIAQFNYEPPREIMEALYKIYERVKAQLG